MLQNFLGAWFFSGGWFAFLWAAGIVLVQGWKARMAAVSLACSGVWLFSAFAAVSGLIDLLPLLGVLHLPFVLWIGPAASAWLSWRIALRKMHRLHFVPGLVLLLLLLPAFNLSEIWIQDALPVLNFITKLHVFFYFMAALGYTYFQMNSAARIKHRRLFLLILCSGLDLLLGIAGQMSGLSIMALISAAILPAILYLGFIFSLKYPDVWVALREDIQKARYEKSRLRGLDVDSLLRKMDEIMSLDRAYQDEDYSMPRFAAEIGISLHQLSEILNDRLGMTFYRYINRFRVGEARELLRSEPDRPVLSVAFAVGFNSRSAFHRAFRKETGMTAADFRRQSPPL